MKELWRKKSIGGRLVAANAASLTLVLLVFSLGVSVLFWKNLEQGLHRELGREFEVVEGLIEVSPTGVIGWGGDEDHQEAEYEGEAIAAEVWASPTELLARTKAAERWAKNMKPAQLRWDATGFDTLDVGNDRVHMLQGQHVIAGRQLVIRVFRSDAPIRETTITLVWILFWGLLFALVLVVATSSRVVSRLFLKPLAGMAEHAARISVDRSGAPVLPIANPNDEIGQLGAVINNVLGRFDAALSRIRRFSADASHELRTPLTSIRSVGEVCLRTEQTPDTYRDSIGSILEEVERLTQLLDSLILLSKADDGKAQLSKCTVSIFALLEEVQEMMAAPAERKGQAISVIGDATVEVNVDATVLRLAFLNLLDNAIKYGPRESVVEVKVSSDDEWIFIDVHNDGEGISSEHQALIFDRFYRVDSGRSRSTGGSGLGLSIARWAVEAHDGTLFVKDDGRSGVTFRMQLRRARQGQL